MKKDPGLIFRIVLMLGDIAAIVLSFIGAYLIRVHLDSRPFYFESNIGEFTASILLLIPIWLIILAALGLYQKSIFWGSAARELGHLALASFIGTMAIITYDFFFAADLFPVRVMALVALALCFVSLFLIRHLLKFGYRLILRSGHYVLRAVVIGNSPQTEFLADYISSTPDCGYKLVGIVANNRYVPPDLKKKKYSSLKEALKTSKADVIFQTDERSTEYTYRQAIQRHLRFYFVPSEAALSSHFGQLELVGNTPAILVRVTPLIGAAKIVKRAMDIIASILALIIAFIPICIIWLIAKILDPKHPVFYASERLSRYNRRFKIYKFRSMKFEYNDMTPEEAFIKMGKPQLIKKYRNGGDQLKNDPRITKFGAFLRRTSLDELPQLWNVLKGDISLVGPRALMPGELTKYGDRALLLSVKSGLTGLAQVSGRRDISFEERRALDIYYIQNWSLLLDLQIVLKTFTVVFRREGAK